MYNVGRNKSLIVLSLFTALTINGILAQSTQQTPTTSFSGTVTGLSFKNAKQPEALTTRAEDIVWKRDVYRIVDLSVSENAALYYPVEITADKKNLFSSLFEAITQSKVKAYEYIDGREVFTDAHAIKIKDMLKRFDKPFKEKTDTKRPGVALFVIDDIDNPTAEVMMYYIKEVVFMDARTSTIQTRTVALCPVLVRSDDDGVNQRSPMFWMPIEALKDYMSEQAIAADSLNSAERLTLYDYFNQRRYKGDIYKVSNQKNQSIYDYCKTPETIKAEQERLEKALKSVENSLWEPNEKALKDARDKEALDKKEAEKLKKTKTKVKAE